jgi:molybdopterin synthase sulfur carrier subunit
VLLDPCDAAVDDTHTVRSRGPPQPPDESRPLALISFTPQLRRFTATPEVECTASTLREALEAAFAVNPMLRGYVLDDQGHLRANVVCFVDGRRCTERVALADPLQPGSRIYVLQALSGG